MRNQVLKIIPKGAILLSGFSAINVILGFVREATIAAFFGASSELDAFLVALTIPRLLAENVAKITVLVVLPVYVALIHGGKKEEAGAVARGWMRLSGGILGVICGLLFVFASNVVESLAPGFSEEAKADSVRWMRQLLPYMWLISSSGVFRMVLESNQKFGAPQVAHGIISICVIASTFLANESLGVGALPVGFVAGGMIGFSSQWIMAERIEPKILSLALPATINGLPLTAAAVMMIQSASAQLFRAVDRFFASSLAEGSIAALNFANAVNSIPRAVITMALSTALFPILAKSAAKGDWQEASKTTTRWILIVGGAAAIPVLFLFFFSEEVVRLIFQRGAFDERATQMTSEVLSIISISIVATTWSVLLVRLLLVQRRRMTIAIAAVVSLLLKLSFNIALVGRYGIKGIAWATVLAALGAMMVRFAFASRKVEAGQTVE